MNLELFENRDGYNYVDINNNLDTTDTILIIHGLFGGLSNFEKTIIELSHSYRVLLPRLPFFEQDGLQKTEQLRDYIFSFLDFIGIESNIHLLGNSLGGQLAILLYDYNPKQFSSIILTGSAGLMENSFGCTIPKRFSENYLEERVKEVFYEKTLDSSYIQQIQSVITNHDTCLRLLKLARNSKKTNIEKALPNIKIPVYLIWGANDQITPPESAYLFKEKIQSSKLDFIDKCGHAPMMEHPKQFAHLCKTFLEKCKLEPHYN